MTCREFQSHWNELLDADARDAAIGGGTAPGRSDTSTTPVVDYREEALLAHAALCPDCRQFAAQWRSLRHAIRAWRQPPQPPAGLADRILVADPLPQSLQWNVVAADERQRFRRRVLVLACSGVAAILMALVLTRLEILLGPAPDGRPANPQAIAFRNQELHSVSDSPRDPGARHALIYALAEATSATWDLARSASEPATRISRDVLVATTRSEDATPERTSDGQLAAGDRTDMGTAGLAVPVPSLEHLALDPSAASTVLQKVGDHLSAGVRPLSDTARHAFGFLIGPAQDQPGSRTKSPSAKGA